MSSEIDIPKGLTIDQLISKNEEWHFFNKDSKFILEMDFIVFIDEIFTRFNPTHDVNCPFLSSNCICGFDQITKDLRKAFQT